MSRRIRFTAAAAAFAVALSVGLPAPAMAGNNGAAALGGFVAGTIFGNAIANPNRGYYPPPVYRPAPVYQNCWGKQRIWDPYIGSWVWRRVWIC